jgi:hypothetical protein
LFGSEPDYRRKSHVDFPLLESALKPALHDAQSTQSCIVKLTVYRNTHIEVFFPFSFFVLTMTLERSTVEVVSIEFLLYFPLGPVEFILRLGLPFATTIGVFEEGQRYPEGCEEGPPVKRDIPWQLANV